MAVPLQRGPCFDFGGSQLESALLTVQILRGGPDEPRCTARAQVGAGETAAQGRATRGQAGRG